MCPKVFFFFLKEKCQFFFLHFARPRSSRSFMRGGADETFWAPCVCLARPSEGLSTAACVRNLMLHPDVTANQFSTRRRPGLFQNPPPHPPKKKKKRNKKRQVQFSVTFFNQNGVGWQDGCVTSAVITVTWALNRLRHLISFCNAGRMTSKSKQLQWIKGPSKSPRGHRLCSVVQIAKI